MLRHIPYATFAVIFSCGATRPDCRTLTKGMGDVSFGTDFCEGGSCVETGTLSFSVSGKSISSKSQVLSSTAATFEPASSRN